MIKQRIEKMINNFVSIKYFVCVLSITNSFVLGMDRKVSLSCLPQEMRKNIFCHCSHNDSDKKIGIVKTLRTAVSFSSVSKRFQPLLDYKTIGTLFDPYDVELKSRLLENIISMGETTDISPTFYPSKRRFILGLVESGANLGESHDR